MLKSRQAKALAGLMGVEGLMTGCPGPNDPAACTCAGNEKDLAFGETCDCGADICDCKVKAYGKINGIPVYRENGVTDVQAATGYEAPLSTYNNYVGGEDDQGRIKSKNLDGFILTVYGWPAMQFLCYLCWIQVFKVEKFEYIHSFHKRHSSITHCLLLTHFIFFLR